VLAATADVGHLENLLDNQSSESAPGCKQCSVYLGDGPIAKVDIEEEQAKVGDGACGVVAMRATDESETYESSDSQHVNVDDEGIVCDLLVVGLVH